MFVQLTMRLFASSVPMPHITNKTKAYYMKAAIAVNR